MNDLLVARFLPAEPDLAAVAAAREKVSPTVVHLGELLGRHGVAFAGSANALLHAASLLVAHWADERDSGQAALAAGPLGRLTILAPVRSRLAEAEAVAAAVRHELAGGKADPVAPSEAAEPAAIEPPQPAVAVAAGWLPLRLFIPAGGMQADLRAVAARLDERENGYLSGLRARVGRRGSERGLALRLRDPERLALSTALSAARSAASDAGVELGTARFVGLVPDEAMLADVAARLGVIAPDEAQRLSALAGRSGDQAAVTDIRPISFVEAVASDKPTPGGGSVAALVGALAAALSVMVAGLTVGRPKFAAAEADMQRVKRRSGELKNQLLDLMLEDIEAFEAVMASYRLPKAGADEAEARRVAIQDSLIRAIEVPLEIMQRAMDVLRLSRVAAEAGNPNAVSDAGVAAYLGHAALQAAALNVEINVLGLRNLDEGDRYRRQTLVLQRDARLLVDEVERIVRARMAG